VGGERSPAEKEAPDRGTTMRSTVPRKRTMKKIFHYLILLEVKENIVPNSL